MTPLMNSSMDLDINPNQQGFSTRSRTEASTSSSSSSSSSSLTIHRVRFPDWQPSSITSLAFPPTSSGDSDSNRNSNRRSILAVGRENGNIELCVWVGGNQEGQNENENHNNTQNDKGWIIHTVLLGATSSRIESLAFSLVPTTIQTNLGSSTKFILRLFSISGGSILTEHFLPTSLSTFNSSIPSIQPKENFGKTYRTLNSNGGSIWSLSPSPLGILLAIGCDDGFVRLISIRDNRFEHVSISEMSRKDSSGKPDERNVVDKFEKVKGRILSLAWGNPIKLRNNKPATRNTNKKGIKEKKIRATGSDDDEESSSESENDSDSDDEDDEDQTKSYKESIILAGTSRSCAMIFKISTGRIITKLVVPKLNKSSNKWSNKGGNGNLGSSLVWSVLILPNGTFVLGDSNSRVTFFDSKTFTLIPGAEFRCHDKNSDVLSLCSSEDGKTVYSGGTDMKVSEISWLDINRTNDGKEESGGKNKNGNRSGKWSHIISRRLHSHDVRSIAIDPPLDLFQHSKSKADSSSTSSNSILTSKSKEQNKKLPILVSGGTDHSLILTPASPPNQVNLISTSNNKKSRSKLKDLGSISYFNSVSGSDSTLFSSSVQRKLAFVPSTAGRNNTSTGGKIVSVAKDVRWILVKRENKVGIWSLGSNSTNKPNSIYERLARNEEEEEEDQVEEEDFNSENDWRKILEIEIQTHTNLDCVEISPDGKWLIISDLYQSKLYKLTKLPSSSNDDDDDEDDEFDLKPTKVTSFGEIFKSNSSASKSPAPSCTGFKFDHDSKRLILATRWDSKIFVIGLPEKNNKLNFFKILKVWDSHVSRFGNNVKEGNQKGEDRAIASNGKVNGHSKMTNGNGNASLSSSDEENENDYKQVYGYHSTVTSSSSSTNLSNSSSTPLISLLVLSKDSKYLFSSDMNKRSYLFNLETLEFIKSLPSTQLPLSDAVFLPNFTFEKENNQQICLLSPNGKLNFHDVSVLSSSSSSSKLIEQRRNLLEHEIKKRLGLFRESCSSLSWISNDSSNSLEKGNTLIISGSSFLLTCKFQGFSSSTTTSSSTSTSISNTNSKKRRDAEDDLPSNLVNAIKNENEGKYFREWNFKHTHKFQSLLHLSEISKSNLAYINENHNNKNQVKELLIIERPFFDLARNLPPGYDSGSKYGT